MPKEPEFCPSGGNSRCVAHRLSVSLPCGKRRHDPGPEGGDTRGRGWCRQLRRPICEERRVIGRSDLRYRECGIRQKSRRRPCN
jgi:hypothetical protein